MGIVKDLWGDARGFAELRYITLDKQAHSEFFVYPKALDSFTHRARDLSGKANVYFGVCLRRRASAP